MRSEWLQGLAVPVTPRRERRRPLDARGRALHDGRIPPPGRRSRLQQAAFLRDGDGFGASGGPQFLKDGLDVGLDALEADAELRRDLPVREPPGDLLQNLGLPRREFGRRRVVLEQLCDLVGKEALPAGDRQDCGDQLIVAAALQGRAERAGVHRL